ncbi:MAG: hypothetical protein DCF29_09395 [Alphaproteobacteria bacterium]|nr:MAG: hypothetical protein DCF29_09395 [Alphaproteobacteria bacterium]
MQKLIVAASFVLLTALAGCGPAPTPETAEVASPPVTAETVATSVPAESFTAADRQELDAALAKIRTGEEVFAGLPNPPLGMCVGKDETLCRYEQLKGVRDWKEAFDGDYGAQRNVAYCLSTGCNGLKPDQVQGCAWRLVIIDAADPEMGQGDVMNTETECGQLSPTAREAAASHAARLAETIQRQAT